VAQPVEATRTEVIFDWAGHAARHTGTVVHRWLQHLATVGPEGFTPERIAGLLPRFRRDLAALGVEPDELPRAAARVQEALLRTLEDPRGRWLLGTDHTDVRSEWAITVAVPGGFQRLVVDRAFVDREGCRWIVDYKTGSHEGGDEEGFLAREAERYREQLARYRQAFQALEDRPVRTALYFPLLGRLVEVL
jgi:ATP-dependent helicase/nuclease subunit A